MEPLNFLNQTFPGQGYYGFHFHHLIILNIQLKSTEISDKTNRGPHSPCSQALGMKRGSMEPKFGFRNISKSHQFEKKSAIVTF